MIIKQKWYGDLEFDPSEKDIVQISMKNDIAGDCELIMIERKNIQKVIELLQKEIKA